jgi:hypothetical protein
MIAYRTGEIPASAFHTLLSEMASRSHVGPCWIVAGPAALARAASSTETRTLSGIALNIKHLPQLAEAIAKALSAAAAIGAGYG